MLEKSSAFSSRRGVVTDVSMISALPSSSLNPLPSFLPDFPLRFFAILSISPYQFHLDLDNPLIILPEKLRKTPTRRCFELPNQNTPPPKGEPVSPLLPTPPTHPPSPISSPYDYPLLLHSTLDLLLISTAVLFILRARLALDGFLPPSTLPKVNSSSSSHP